MIVIPVEVDSAGIEYVPEWTSVTTEYLESGNRRMADLVILCNKIAEMLNYFQTNTATAFGNPDYSRLTGVVCGLCMGLHCCYDTQDGWAYVTTESGRCIIKIQIPKQTEFYKQSVKEANELLGKFGL